MYIDGQIQKVIVKGCNKLPISLMNRKNIISYKLIPEKIVKITNIINLTSIKLILFGSLETNTLVHTVQLDLITCKV
jgi:hypothetical protein